MSFRSFGVEASGWWIFSQSSALTVGLVASPTSDDGTVLDVLHRFEDGAAHNRDYIPQVSRRYPNLGPVLNFDTVAGWRCFSDVNKTCSQASSWPPQAVPRYPTVPQISGASIPMEAVQRVPDGMKLATPYAGGKWQAFQVHAVNVSAGTCTEFAAELGTIWHRVWLGIADRFDFGGAIGVQTDVLVLDEEEWSVSSGGAPPSDLPGGMRLERYLYPKGAWGRSVQLGAENAACRANPMDASACNGSYTLQGGVVFWNTLGTSSIDSPDPACALRSTVHSAAHL